ncbi:hypothetical protein FGD71_006105 [Streptomyces sporangiiformans]|uniref:Uncharacterized protein n=1 Tax=Streptomyces sporangiiformans TaxID=2315329 RepID=A0A505DPH4_9ACTN|nr:hypothetical protein FGD71_006105 [Streptomyces sporangiiformans]
MVSPVSRFGPLSPHPLSTPPSDALVRLLGRGRASVLAALDEPVGMWGRGISRPDAAPPSPPSTSARPSHRDGCPP